MAKKSKIVYIVGSIVIGIAAVLIVILGLIAGGVINARQRKLVITSASAEFVYDGTPKTCEEWTITNGKLQSGHSALVVVSGSQTDAGSSPNYISATIVDKNGADVTGDYDLEYQFGTLTVTRRSISVTSDSATKPYDGTALTCESYKISGGELCEGHEISALFSGSQTNAGSAQNAFAIKVLDSNGADKSANYALTLNAGMLTVTKRPVKFRSGGARKIYDGTPLTNTECELIEDNLLEGHTAVYAAVGSITDAGETPNTISVTITDGDGATVTENYELVLDEGTLEVTALDIRIRTASASKPYDGTPLTADGYEVTGGTLLQGHTLSVRVTGSITEIGSTPNSFTATVTAQDGKDVTANYNFGTDEGTLKITGKEISVETKSGVKVYDGTPLTAMPDGWAIVSETGLDLGHSITSVKMPAEITAVGSVPNYISEFIISDSDGNDVSHLYEITYFLGNLMVTPRPLAVRSADDAKDYDGTPLTNPNYAIVSETQPVQSHTLTVVVSGTRTEPGESPNTIAEVILRDADGANVTRNYEILKQNGVLVVRGSGGTSSGGASGGLATDGEIGGSGSSGGTAEGEKSVAFSVYSSVNSKLYMRLKSFGDYDGKKWGSAQAYAQLLDGTHSYNYLTGKYLNTNGYSLNTLQVRVNSDDYLLPYYTGLGEYDYTVQTSDVYYSGATREYSLEYYIYDYLKSGADGTKVSDGSYAAFVRSHYITVPESTQACLDGIIAEQGFNKNDTDIAAKVAAYIRGCAAYNLDYNTALDDEDDIIVAFLTGYHQGVCRHYASAATLMFRRLGIPARYVIGYAADAEQNEWTEVTGDRAHAWTEIYLDGVGWVMLEVTGSSSAGGTGNGSGSGEGSGSGGQGTGGEYGDGTGEIKIKPVNEYYLYDGYTSFTHSGALQGLSDLTSKGYTYSATVEGSRKNLGKTQCKITSFKLIDPDGKDVTAEYLKLIKFSSGTLQVYAQVIQVTTDSATQTYSGAPLTASGLKITSGSLMQGHTMTTFKTIGAVSTVGADINEFEIRIADEHGDDVTDIYKIDEVLGTLEVTPREITVTSGSKIFNFTSGEVTYDHFTLTGELVSGHTIDVNITGSQQGPGISDNTIRKVTIKDADGADVTANYKINIVHGELTVLPPA